MQRSFLDSPRVGLVLALVLCAVGGALRGFAATHGWIADEIGWVMPGGPAGNWAHAETAVNPPGLRMLASAIAGRTSEIPVVGRTWSVIAGTATIPLMFLLGRSVGRGSNLAGFATGLLWMVLPLALQQAGLFRSYATLSLVLSWHLLALLEVSDRADGPPSQGQIVQLVISAALLPQVHYATVPILALEGVVFAAWLRDRTMIHHYLPAAALFLPLAVRILGGTSEHLAPQSALSERLARLLQADLDFAVLPLALPVTLLCWTLLDRRARALALAAVTAVAGMAIVAAYHDARPDLGIVFAVYELPLLAALPTLIRGDRRELWAARAAAWLILVGVWLAVVRVPAGRALFPWMPDRNRELARDMKVGAFPDDHPTWLLTPESVHAVAFELSGAPARGNCAVDPGRACFEYRHSYVAGFEGEPLEPGYVVVFTPESQEALFGDQCHRVKPDARYRTWFCPNGWTP